MKPAVLLLALASIALAQGPLTPPGPPGLTMKSLDEVEPRIPLNQTNTPGDATCVFKITKAGSYYLTGNVTAPPGKKGIVIAAIGEGASDVNAVVLDLSGYTLAEAQDGSGTDNANIYCPNGTGSRRVQIANGTLLATSSSNIMAHEAEEVIAVSHTQLRGGSPSAATAGRLLMNDVSIADPHGAAIIMGSDSVLSHVEITGSGALTAPLISGTGNHHVIESLSTKYTMFGSVTGIVRLGANSRVTGLMARITGGSFTGPVLGNTSGFSEVSGLTVELSGCTAPAGVSNWATSSPGWEGPDFDASKNLGDTGTHDTGTIASRAGIPKVIATNCTFTTAAWDLTSDGAFSGRSLIAHIRIEGTTTTPSAVHNDGEIYAGAMVSMAPTASVTGPVISINGSGCTVASRITGIPSNGVGVLIAGGNGNEVVGCRFIGANGAVNPTGVRIAAGATNTLVRNLDVSGFPAVGPVVVDNLGGVSNIVAPILSTSGTIAGTVNPFASIVH